MIQCHPLPDKIAKHKGDSSKLQGDLNFAFDQRESEVNLHNVTSSPELPSNVSPGVVLHILYMILFHLETKDKVLHLTQCKKKY